MKWIVRIVTGLVVAIVVMIIALAGVIYWDTQFGVSASDFTNASYTAEGGTTLNGYLAQPEGEGPFPGVLMVHEWWGLNAEIIELADELAEEGYVVLAPDTYRGPTAAQIPGALYLRLSIDMERVDADMRSAYDYLASLDNVAENIGVVGFCYGGDVAMNHAIDNPEIDATINLYGSTLADSTAYGALLEDGASPVLGIFGAEDQGIPVDSVNAYEAALNEAGVTNTVTIYDGMGHAFVQPDAIEEDGAPREAWLQILDFFEAQLATDAPESSTES